MNTVKQYEWWVGAMAAVAMGFGVSASAVPGGLPACQSALNTCTADLGSCTTSLTSSQANLATCNSSLTTTQTSFTQCTTNLATCNADLAQAQQFPATGGNDGAIQAGKNLSYTDTGNGTIIDNNTHLEWEKKTSDPGSIHYVISAFTFSQALAYIDVLNTDPCFAGYCDWRLPNVKELQSIVNYGRSNPSIDPVFGPTLAIYHVLYRSSTMVTVAPGNAWVVDFNLGYVFADHTVNDGLWVRAVRGGLVN
jgi:hypothetical protein